MPLLNNNVLVCGNDAVARVFGASRESMDRQLRGFHSSAAPKKEQGSHDPSSTGIPEPCVLVKDGEPTPAAPKPAPAAKAPEPEALSAEVPVSQLSDDEVVNLVEGGRIPSYNLEKSLGDLTRAVGIRRQLVGISPRNDYTLTCRRAPQWSQNNEHVTVQWL